MEFHALILCGHGHELNPFTLTSCSKGFPKAFLTVGNEQLIEHVLKWCREANFSRITLVCEPGTYLYMIDYIDGKKKINPNDSNEDEKLNFEKNQVEFWGKVDVVSINMEENGEIIYYLYQKKILNGLQDFIILPCDFVTNFESEMLIKAFRSRPEHCEVIFMLYNNISEGNNDKSKHCFFYTEKKRGEFVFIGLDSVEQVYDEGNLTIQQSLIHKISNITITKSMTNSSIFLCSMNIMNLIAKNEEKFDSTFFKERSLLQVFGELSLASISKDFQKRAVNLFLLPKSFFFYRCNNLKSLMAANQYYMRIRAASRANIYIAQKEKNSATVGIESIVGTNSELGDKTNVKKTIIGENCKIGKKVKLTNCLLFNNVKVEDNVHLENCIIGNNAYIQSLSKLINCNVEPTHKVIKKTEIKGLTLLCFDINLAIKHDKQSEADNLDISDSSELSFEYLNHDSEDLFNENFVFSY